MDDKYNIPVFHEPEVEVFKKLIACPRIIAFGNLLCGTTTNGIVYIMPIEEKK